MADEINGGRNKTLGKLPRFDGRGSLQIFLKRFSQRAEIEDWNEREKTTVLLGLCTDLAEAFLNSRPALYDASYDDLVVKLTERFTPTMTNLEAYEQLKTVRQGDSSISEYVEQIEKESGRLADALSAIGEEERERMMIKVFISGANSKYKTGLTAAEFTTYKLAVAAAKRLEIQIDSAVDQPQSRKTMTTQNTRPGVLAIRAAPATEQVNDTTITYYEDEIDPAQAMRSHNTHRRYAGSGQLNHYPRPIRHVYSQRPSANHYRQPLSANRFRQPIQANYQGRQNSYPPPRGYYNNYSNSLGCWTCGATDHFRSDCPQYGNDAGRSPLIVQGRYSKNWGTRGQ